MGAAFDLLESHLLLKDGGAVERIDLDASFWPDVTAGRRPLSGRLVGASRLSGDLDHWEMHTEGDEVLLRQSGDFDVVIEECGGRRVVELRASTATCLVPRGAWHTIRVREPGVLIFATAGQGTQRRPV